MVRIRWADSAVAIALFGALTAIAACSSYVSPRTTPEQVTQRQMADESAPRTTLRYERDIRPLIQVRCTPCHFSGGYMYGAVPLDSYREISRRAETIKQVVLVSKRMPFQQPMPDEERALIAEWISAGVPQ